MSKKALGVVMDSIGKIKPYKDTTLSILRTATAMAIDLYYIEQNWLSVEFGKAIVTSRKLEVFDDNDNYYKLGEQVIQPQLDAILMRVDPPFNLNYIYTTYILEMLQKHGIRIANKPSTLRDFNEKVIIGNFPKLTPKTIITSNFEQIQQFVKANAYTILKPLDGMGGTGVFRLATADPNLGSTYELLTENGKTPIMAQEYIPQVIKGDKRIFIIAGKVAKYCLARIPKSGEIRANLAAGGRGVVQELSARDYEIADSVAEFLSANGVLFAGLDVIGDYLTEVNITSPTGVVEIAAETGYDIGRLLLEAIFKRPFV